MDHRASSDPSLLLNDTRARPRRALAALVATMALSSLGTSVANVALPTLIDAFSMPARDVQWVVLGYLVATTALVVPAGRAGDRFGRRAVLTGGIATFAAGSAACAAAPSLWALVGGRVVQGAGGAAMLALTVALVRESVPPDRVGSAMGLLGSASAVGTAAGPSIGGLLVQGPGWRAAFVALAVGAAATLLLARALPASVPSRTSAGSGLDPVGVLLLTATLVLFALAATTATHRDAVVPLAGTAAACLFGLVVIERRSAHPVIELRLLRDRARAGALTANLLVATIMMTTLIVAPFYLTRGLGLPIAAAGAVMAVGPLISMVTGAPSGRLVDRFGSPTVLVCGLALVFAGTTVLALAWAHVAGYLCAIVILTPGYQLFQAANNTAMMTSVDAARQGLAGALLTLSRNVGLILGASVMGTLLAAGAATSSLATAPSDAVISGSRLSFAVGAALALAALAATGTRPRRSRPVSR